MKILKKNEAIAEVAKQKREQIDEGIALATKVDLLRSTIGNLEQQHTQYIAGMKDSLEKEIEPLKREKESLKFEVESARKELVRLRMPLDDEWKRVKEEAAGIMDKTLALNMREHYLIEAEQDIKNEREGIKVERAALISLRDDAIEDTVLAGDIKAEAERVLRKAKIDSEHKIDALSKKEKELHAREKEVSYREVDVSSRETLVTQRTTDLDNKERFINDKYETLQRTISRIKQ